MHRFDPDEFLEVAEHLVSRQSEGSMRSAASRAYYGVFILEPLEVFGVDNFTDWAMQLKLRIKTVPQRQHEVGRELRKRIRQAFDENGIAVPFPERLVAVREGAKQ